MPSVLDLAKCSNAVYSNLPEVSGWRRTTIYNPFESGFFAVLFTRGGGATSEAVFAIRGTDDLGHDLISDSQLALGMLPTQARHAKMALIDALAIADVSLDRFFLTGHSLGGGIAALKSARHTPHLPVVTFNAPGMYRAAIVSAHGAPTVLKMHGSLREYRGNFKKAMHIRSEHDIVSIGTGPRIMGKVMTLPNSQCETKPLPLPPTPLSTAAKFAARALCAHKMTVLLSLIESQASLREAIEWG